MTRMRTNENVISLMGGKRAGIIRGRKKPQDLTPGCINPVWPATARYVISDPEPLSGGRVFLILKEQ